jgi:hypothetical protein
MTSSDLETFERCSRLLKWQTDHLQARVKPIAALYAGIEAGVEGKSAKDAVMALAASPGLDITGVETYSVAIHLAHLAEILSTYLLAGGSPWTRSGSIYECGGDLRRIVLIDRWSEDRKMAEIRSWRTMAEVCRRDAPMLLNFLVIGSSSDNRRISAWTRGWTHPRNFGLRFKKKDGEPMGEGWTQQWRERSGIPVERWLGKMQSDRSFDDLVHSVRVIVPRRRDDWLRDIERIEREIVALPDNPPMNRGGCYRFSPCVFTEICHGLTFKTPSECGWVKVSDIGKSPIEAPVFSNLG